MTTPAWPSRLWLLAALLGAAGCRYEVHLRGNDAGADDATDASSSDVTTADVPLPRDAGWDTDRDAGPGRACEGEGVELGVARLVIAPDDGPSLVVLDGASRRYALLVPPASRADGSVDSRLLLLDEQGSVSSDRSLALGTGRVSLHAVGETFLILTETEIHRFDAAGVEDGPPIALPESPFVAWQRNAGFVSPSRFVYAGSSHRLVVLDGSSITVTSIDTTAEQAVFVDLGAVTSGHAFPSADVVELGPDLAPTLTATLPGVVSRRLLGADVVAGERRWLVSIGDELRLSTELYRVSDTGTFESLASTILFGTTSTAVRDGLVAVRVDGGGQDVFDLRAPGTMRTFSGHAVVVRDGSSLAALTIESRASNTVLVFRCGL